MKKTLSVRFKRAVGATGRPESLEVVVTPLNGANSSSGDATYVADKQSQRVVLSDSVTVVKFDLIPSYMPGLDRPIFYRIGWRKGYMGRITQADFTMPDMDVDFDDLGDLGSIIDGQSYLKEEDLGVPGRVARLANDGSVLDGDGNPIGSVQLDGLTAELAQEVRDRKTQGSLISRDLTLRLETQINSVVNTLNIRVSAEATARANAIEAEALTRANADATLLGTVNSNQSQLLARLSSTDSAIEGVSTALSSKADLVGGKVPTSQIPSVALGTAVPVADEAAMLALTPSAVQPGDVAVRPDGTFMLVREPASAVANWVKFAGGDGRVSAVNGQTGNVTLGADDVGARSVDSPIPIGDVSGLGTALSAKANLSALNAATSTAAALDTKVTGIDARLTTLSGQAVKMVGGVIPTSLLDVDVPRISPTNQFLRKDGTIIPVGGGGGTGAVNSVNGHAGDVILVAADIGARSNTVPIPQSEVEGLDATLTAKASNSALSATNTRVSRLEVQVSDLEANGGGGGGGGSSSTTVSYVGNPGDAPSSIRMKSPFGILTANGAPYYDPNGSIEGEEAYPYVDENGYLTLRQLNPTAQPAPLPVGQTEFTGLSLRVTTLENSSAAKPEGGWLREDMEIAAQNDFMSIEGATTSSTPNSVVKRNAQGTFAVSEAVSNNHPATKGAVDTAIALKADKSTVNALTTTVSEKAAAGDVVALDTRLTNAVNSLPSKADLDINGFVPLTQVPILPATKVTGMNLKADLDGVGGRLPVSQLPSAIPQSQVSNLTTALSGKADLVGGKIPTSQIPVLATSEVYTVANRSAMLALTTAQVQRGDLAVITAGSDQGSYILNADDPSVFGNWVLLRTPSGSVQTVNGQSGSVILGAADVGARPNGVAIPQTDVSGLTSDLAAKAATTYVDGQVSGRTTPAQVTAQINSQAVSKPSVDYATTAAVTLSGAQSLDGVLVGAGKTVLLAGQSASSQNGFWVVATGAWSRLPSSPTGSMFSPNTIVVVKSGSSHTNSIWQLTTATSGTVDTNGQSWSKIMQGGPLTVYTGGNGIAVSPTGVVSGVAGPGIIVDSQGIRTDPSTAVRKFPYDIPGGNTVVSVPHNLNTRDVIVQVYDTATGDLVMLGVTANTVNAVTLEFETAPAQAAYRAIVMG